MEQQPQQVDISAIDADLPIDEQIRMIAGRIQQAQQQVQFWGQQVEQGRGVLGYLQSQQATRQMREAARKKEMEQNGQRGDAEMPSLALAGAEGEK